MDATIDDVTPSGPRDALVAPFVQLRVSGRDATRYLQGQLSQDVAALTPEAPGSISVLLGVDGHLITWLRVRRLADDAFSLVVSEPHAERVRQRLEQFRIRTHATIELLAGHLLAPTPDDIEPLWPLDRDAPFTDAPVDLERFHAARLVAGAFDPGTDLVDGVLAHGVPTLVERGVSFTKGCYTGQELVARTSSRGVAAPIGLVALDLAEPIAIAPGTPLLDSDAEVGAVTTAGVVDGHGYAIAFRRRRARELTRFVVGGVSATVRPSA